MRWGTVDRPLVPARFRVALGRGFDLHIDGHEARLRGRRLARQILPSGIASKLGRSAQGRPSEASTVLPVDALSLVFLPEQMADSARLKPRQHLNYMHGFIHM
jgi:hypothetical protein